MPKEIDYSRVDQVYPNELFWRIFDSTRKQMPDTIDHTDSVVIALDPGETTGLAIRYPHSQIPTLRRMPINLSHLDTHDLLKAGDDLWVMLTQIRKAWPCPIKVIYEDYRIYSWKSDDHKWSPLHTAQWIGTIRFICHYLSIPVYTQMAVVAKRFVTDQRLEEWECYNSGLKHARDAERHLLHYLIFGSK